MYPIMEIHDECSSAGDWCWSELSITSIMQSETSNFCRELGHTSASLIVHGINTSATNNKRVNALCKENILKKFQVLFCNN